MSQKNAAEMDAAEEFRIRSWARENSCPIPERDGLWHPIALDEMRRKDLELVEHLDRCRRMYAFVPLVPDALYGIHPPHPVPAPKLLLTVAAIPHECAQEVN